jgi:hypothetical protein
MIVSLFTFLVLRFKVIKLLAMAILLIIRYWASWFDRPFIMGDTEDELNFSCPQKYYQLLNDNGRNL